MDQGGAVLPLRQIKLDVIILSHSAAALYRGVTARRFAAS